MSSTTLARSFSERILNFKFCAKALLQRVRRKKRVSMFLILLIFGKIVVYFQKLELNIKTKPKVFLFLHISYF